MQLQNGWSTQEIQVCQGKADLLSVMPHQFQERNTGHVSSNLILTVNVYFYLIVRTVYDMICGCHICYQGYKSYNDVIIL